MVQDCAKARFVDPGMFRDRSMGDEMRSFHVNPDNGRPEAALDSYDDRIIAKAIAHRVAGDEVLGGKGDIYMQYGSKEPSHPLIDLAERLEAVHDSDDAARPVLQMLKNRDFDLINGSVEWFDE